MGKKEIDLIEEFDRHTSMWRFDRRTGELFKSASQRFQKLVDVALFDGYLSNSEAHMLVQEHNRMQETSRARLRQILKKHGYTNEANEGVRLGSVHIKKKEDRQWIFPDDTTIPSKFLTPKPYTRLEVTNNDAYGRNPYPIEFMETIGDTVKRPGKKARFFLIIVVPMIVVLLKLAGAF